jgi:hybrid cluster-associated redox disulfide protein
MIFRRLKNWSKPEKKNTQSTKKARSEHKLPITKETNLGELAMEYPQLAQVLTEDYGLHCVGCFASSFDTIETGAQVHGMTEPEIDEMIARLKKLASKQQ